MWWPIVDEAHALIKTKSHRIEKERNKLKDMIDQIHEALDEANSTLYKHKDIQTRLTISGLTLGKIAVIVKHGCHEYPNRGGGRRGDETN